MGDGDGRTTYHGGPGVPVLDGAAGAGADRAPDFRALFEAISDAYLVLAPDPPQFTILAASDGYLGASRRIRADMLGRALFDVFPDANPDNRDPSGVANLRASLETVLSTRAAHRMAIQRYDVDGPDGDWQVRYWATRNSPVFGALGEIRYLLHHVEDVTERVAERAATTTAERGATEVRAVLQSIADPFYLLDRDWRFTYVNDAAEPLLRTTRDKLLGRTLWEMFPDVAHSEFEAPYREAMATGRPTSAEAWFEPLGAWFDVRSYPWPDGLMVHFRDVSARRAAEAERELLMHALQVERTRLADVFHRAPSFIVAFRGPDQVYDFVNEAYYQLVGHREIIGKPLVEALPEIRGQGYHELLEHVRQTGEPWVGRETPVMLQRTPGAPLEARYLDMVFQPLTEADGTRSGVVVHGSDITAQVLARREVEVLLRASEEARADAEAANRAKSEFLAVMSHELRTPLNAIGGYTELLEMGIRGPITAEQRADLARIQQSQRHLLGLINGVLNYARVEAGAVHYSVEAVPLGEVLAACETLIAPQVRERGLTLDHEQCDGSLAVRADREKLQQIVINLLSNAVKFTEPGGRVALRGDCSADGASVVVQVSDTGIGIAAEQLERAFEPFVQIDAKLTRNREGTGLGLAISRDLARGMGGEISAESVLGEGSTFTLVLPVGS